MTVPLQRGLPRPTSAGGPRPGTRYDLLRLPVVGRFLRWKWSRVTLQIPLLALSVVMVIHALFGPDKAAKNLGSLLTWVHFRGLVVVAILLAGNLFCMACPFMLPRAIARKLFVPRWRWPRALRNKWAAIGLFVAVLFVYELFDLWSLPWWTGMLILGYFAAALIVDALFERATFCKYICPVGQFNFLSSTLAPLEVAVRDRKVCLDCETKDCIRGTWALANNAPHANAASHSEAKSGSAALPVLPVLQQRGCELALFQPRKVGNLDCTFCLDCVYACPHENIGILARVPGEELMVEGARSGLGRIERRFDFTALAVVFTFGAVLNAFAMISPVYALEQSIAGATGLQSEWPILAAMFAVGLILEPAILLLGAAYLTRWLSGSAESIMALVKRFSRSLLPLGFGIWLAHYGFHFFTGCYTIVPVTQNAVARAFGSPLLGEPAWQLGGFPDSVVFLLELGFLGLGLLGSLWVAWTIAGNVAPQRTWRGFVSWGLLYVAMFAAAVWIMTQPMDMRGTSFMDV